MDFQKAFDSVNHRLLLLKLKTMCISEKTINWVKEFLANRRFSVTVEGTKSREGQASSGVPQGSVLGPLLFLVYINDLVDNLKCPSYMFADDVKLLENPTTDDL